MWVVERSKVPEPRWENRPARNRTADPKRPRLRHPVTACTWLPRGSRPLQRDDRGPVFVSFVSRAVLWDRGLCHHTARVGRPHRPSLCPRFLSHMRACPEDLRPARFLSTESRPQPPSLGNTHRIQALAAPKSQTLEDRRSGVQDKGLVRGRRAAVVVIPCITVQEKPPLSTIDPTPLPDDVPHRDSGGERIDPNPVPASPRLPHLSPEGKENVQERERAPQVALESVSPAEPDWKHHLEPDGPEPSASPASRPSDGSLSDFSRPRSSLFSRSTDLASGRSSVLSAGTRDFESGARLSEPPPPSALLSPPASRLPSGIDPPRSPDVAPPPLQPLPVRTKHLSCDPSSSIHPHPSSVQPLSSSKRTESSRDLPRDASTDPAVDPSSEADHGPVPAASPSATWSSCPSPQRTTPRSGSGGRLTPSSSMGRLKWESDRWPVLPPISPVKGRCDTAASRYSELSCSQSHVFDELEAIAPRSSSCLSLDLPLSSTGCPSPDTELSPGLAALTVGCDSGKLGSLSRVRLLLLDRPEPETPPSPDELSPIQDWSTFRMQHYAGLTSGALRPLTAGSVSERCDSAGKVQENKPEPSEEDSGSPRSWIIDPSPSDLMFRCSPCKSDHTSSADEGGPTVEDWMVESPAGRRRRRPWASLERRAEERSKRMEERKTKAMKVLSKLQDDAPPQPSKSHGRSKFEDFDFLAKYCIFSQEKLAEYKRAFEAEDSDSDGFLSCLQVLLALKTIIPPELLSEEEEIYVYRILEMVDFRVTDGLADLRLFAVIASLAQKIASMDDFMRSLINTMDFRSLEVRLFKAKQLFLFLLEEQPPGDAGAPPGFISAEQLLLELRAGGIRLEQEVAVTLELGRIPPLDLLDFLAYLPLFMLIHKSVISNPLNDSSSF